MTLAYWVHDLDPFLIQFSETLGIRYYGLAYLLGFLGGAGLLYAAARRGRLRIAPEGVADLMFVLVVGVLVGGRLGYFVFYQPGVVLRDPLALFRVWDGGMASHGGFIGVAIALLWFARSRKVPLLHVADAVVAAAPLGLFFGRIANFINGELWGRVSRVPWAVVFPESAGPGTPVGSIDPRHPSQLYAAALEGALLLAFCQWRFWRSDVAAQQPGRLSGEFLIGYALVRSVGELFREPDAPLIFGLTRGTFYSLFLILAGVVLIVAANRRRIRRTTN